MVNKYKQPVKKHYINLLVTKYVDSLKLEEHQIVHFCARKPQKNSFRPVAAAAAPAAAAAAAAAAAPLTGRSSSPCSQEQYIISAVVQFNTKHCTALHCTAMH